ncbi:hypothetical protein HQ535_10595, partial [bacterium]|nr:hypothetical protein [bacterium]
MSIEIYDTTLRDGTQRAGLSLTAQDKLRVARLLDDLGVAYIEGGWPGANPKDDEFFARAATELDLETATLTAFGSTRRPGVAAADDPGLVLAEDYLARPDLLLQCLLAPAPALWRWLDDLPRGSHDVIDKVRSI